MKKGKLVVIEGNDGSGKGTQHKMLLDYLSKNEVSYSAFDFPQYETTFFGNFIGRFLNGDFGHVSRINPYLAMFPYAGDRWQVREKMWEAINTGKLVICNRYAPSIAYQVVKVKPSQRFKFLDWAEKLEYKTFGIPREDWVIFLYVPFDIAHKLIEKKGERKYLNAEKIHDQYEDYKYLKRVEKMYLWLSKVKKNWIRIDCCGSEGEMRTKEEIFKEILERLKEKKVI